MVQWYLKMMPWLGSKLRMLPQFLAMLIPMEEYYELFVGAGSVFLNKPASKVEVLCDKDIGIATLWKVLGDGSLRDEFKTKVLALEADKLIFDLFRKSYDSGFPNLSEVDIAVVTYYMTVYSFDGNRENMRYGGKQEEWRKMGEDAKRKLLDNWDMITNRARQAVVLNENAMEVLEIVKDRENATILLDPPYVEELLGDNKNLYRECFGLEEQVQMLKMIQNCKAKIILCGYRGGSLLYDRFLNKDTGWHCYIVERKLPKSSSSSEVRGYAQEFVWVNYEIPERARFVMDTTDWALMQEEADSLSKLHKVG